MNNTETFPPISQRSPILRFFRWFFTLRILGRFALAGATLITLVALWLTLTSYSGKRAWDAYRKAAEAKGEKLDVASFIPPAVPDDKNFAMTPLLAPLQDYTRTKAGLVWRNTNGNERAKAVNLGNEPRDVNPIVWRESKYSDMISWQKYFRAQTNFPAATRAQSPAEDVLFALSRFDAELAELQAARQRPSVRFNLHYEEGIGIILNHFGVIRSLNRVFTQRALAELEAGRAEAALKDVDMAFYMTDALNTDALMINLLVRIAQVEYAMQSVYEGLGKRKWSEAQITALQARLKGFDFLADYERAVRFERAAGAAALENLGQLFEQMESDDSIGVRLARFYPWKHHNQLAIAQLMDDYLIPSVDVQKHRAFPEFVRAKQIEVDQKMGHRSVKTIFANLLFPAFEKAVWKTAACQSAIDQAQIACALERYRMANNEYPETLALLAPKFMDKVPVDLVTGEPMKYRRIAGGKFILYSVGWPGSDGGGKLMMTRSKPPRIDMQKSDWIWRYPEAKQ